MDINVYTQSKDPNPYTPFLDEYELKEVFRLVKYRISKKAIDNLMTVHTVKSNLPKAQFKSTHILRKKLHGNEPPGIGKHSILSTINYNADNSETHYF